MAGSEFAKIQCGCCPHSCLLTDGQLGRCGARVGSGSKVVPQNYGRLTSLALDPIEKKPLARFMPGSKVLSLGSYGCNMGCPWCQNHGISQVREGDVPWRQTTPEELVNKALELGERGCRGIAYTYNEPFLAWEFIRDCGKLAHENGLVNVVVSNGMVLPGVLDEVLPLIDAANIDLKAFRQSTYDLCGGDLATVTATIQAMAACETCHLEVTWLVVPGVTDDKAEFAEACDWLASLDPDIPLHVSRFFPRYKMLDRLPTDIQKVYGLAELARTRLNWVFTGNC